MPPTKSEPAGTLAAAVTEAGNCPQLLEGIRAVYARAEAEIATLQAPCRQCGQCCRFDTAGHRLYASTGELALLVSATAPPAPGAPMRCPWQAGDACTARDIRTLGCRVFFCAEDLAHTTHTLYETCHAAIRDLHDRCGVPYHYVELTAAIAELG